MRLNVYSDQDDIQNYWATTVHGGEEGTVNFGRTDNNPRMQKIYQNKSINTNTRLQKDAHSALHSESMGTAIGQWLEGREAKYPPVILDDDGTGQ
jgi:hypothetical protein